MRNIRFVVSYDGTAYSGFQTQPSGNTIQDHLEASIRKLTGEEVKLTSSGRTDCGVHARLQICNFHTRSSIPIERWSLALNSRLPNDIVVLGAEEVPLDFHSRKSAKRKTYCYTIRTGRFPDVFQRKFQFHHPAALDVSAMKEALNGLVGEHDFTSFCSVKTEVESHVRTIYEAYIDDIPDPGDFSNPAGLVRIYITGNGFLYNMVRIIAGTLIEIGEGKRQASEMVQILHSRNRKLAGPTAVAHALMLWNVEY